MYAAKSQRIAVMQWHPGLRSLDKVAGRLPARLRDTVEAVE
ncbi:MAG: hypothetical protein ACRD3Q_14910 [Terriglobales bacterium]